VSAASRGATLRTMIRTVVVIGVLLTPLFNAGEIVALIAGAVRSQTEALTPVYIKALKDVCFAILGLLGAAALATRGRASVLVYPFLIFALYVAAGAIQSYSVDPQLALAGLRWVFPIFLAFLLIGHVDRGLVTRVSHLTALLLVLHVALQAFQLFFMSDWFGTNVFGLAGRVPGMFFIPNTAGFYVIVCLFLARFYGERPWLRRIVYVLAPVSIALTQSGTGLVVYALVMVFLAVGRFGARRAAPVLALAPLAAIALLPLLPQLTGRGADYVAVSGGGRVEILLRLIDSGDLFPQLFGHATNTAVSFAATLRAVATGTDVAVITDSTYASIVGNLGLLGLVSFLLGGAIWALFLIATPRLELYVFTAIFGLYGATTVVTEAYPMSLIFAVLFAHYAEHSFGPFLVRAVTGGDASRALVAGPAGGVS